MRLFSSIFFIAVCISVFTVEAQDKKLSKKELIEQADYYFFKEDFAKAIVLYDSILHNYPKNHYTQYHQYVSHHLTDGRGTDLSGLKEFEKNEGHTDKFYNYWLGRIHHGRYEFDIAAEHFRAFLELDIYRTKEIHEEAVDRLKKADRAQAFYLDANEYEVERLPSPINSAYTDLSPAFFAGHNELLFVSSRPDSEGEDWPEDQFRIFHTESDGNENWSTPSSLAYLALLSRNNAKIEVVNNDGRLFLYKEDLSNQGNLFYAEPVSNGWSLLKEFDADLKNRQIASDFFINDQESVIYFSAKSSFGDLNIYETSLDPTTQTWIEPFPVLGELNSESDEDSPFLSHDGQTLYFSSDRPESIGGFDVFSSTWIPETQSWGKPINLGFPINTIDDEIHFQLNEDNISGFFSSSRLHSMGDLDIYHFHKQGKVLVTGNVYDEKTGSKLMGIQIDFKPSKYVDERFRATTNEFGAYQKEILQDEKFIVELSINGQLLKTEELTSHHEELKKSFTKNFEVTLPEKIEQKTNYAALYDNKQPESKYEKLSMLGSKFRVGQKAMLRNIYFDIQSAKIQQESAPVLNGLLEMMNEYSNLKIQIEGHTDNTGSESVNIALSTQRAQSVKNYLVSNKISASRVDVIGYGSSQPLATNDDEENGRELNRRIEVIVIE